MWVVRWQPDSFTHLSSWEQVLRVCTELSGTDACSENPEHTHLLEPLSVWDQVLRVGWRNWQIPLLHPPLEAGVSGIWPEPYGLHVHPSFSPPHTSCSRVQAFPAASSTWQCVADDNTDFIKSTFFKLVDFRVSPFSSQLLKHMPCTREPTWRQTWFWFRTPDWLQTKTNKKTHNVIGTRPSINPINL